MAKSTKAEIDQRVQAIYLLLLRRETRTSILQFVANKGWGSKRTADDYIKRARDLMREESQAERDDAISEHLALRRDLFNKAYKERKWAIAFQIVQDEAKLQGLYFDLPSHLKAALAAGYKVYAPTDPEAASADRAAAGEVECEIEVGLASPPDGGASLPEAV